MKTTMLQPRSIVRYFAACLLATACLAFPVAAHAKNEKPALATVAQRHGECLRPSFKTDEAVASEGTGGYGIEVQGERYWVALDERMTFALLPQEGGDAIAQVKLDRPPAEDFDEQARWRARWLEDVAERAGVPLNRQALAGDAQLLTLNKKTLTGKFVGLSLLVDTQRKLFVQWDWSKLSRYTGPQDALAAQTAVWERLIPCLLKSY
ncbi:hypothetical protein AAKU55_005097 [Oxalobacteraceae bacterium GrIS 1.11]